MTGIKTTGEKKNDVLLRPRPPRACRGGRRSSWGSGSSRRRPSTSRTVRSTSGTEESARGADCFVIQSHTAPINQWIMEQLIMIDALKRASARSSP